MCRLAHVEFDVRNSAPRQGPILDYRSPRALRASLLDRRCVASHQRSWPVALDCSFKSACERCNFFETGPQFIPILRRQRDHATEHAQEDRIVLFDRLIKGIDGEPRVWFDEPQSRARGSPV
jgi:hypothetical protein